MRNDTNETVWIEARAEDGTPLVVEEVIGTVTHVRQVDPCDPQPADRIPLDPGHELAVSTAIASVGLMASGEAGANDLLFPLRVVPVRRDAGVVYGRTLRSDETDDGRRVHVRPGETFTLEPGSLVVELDAVDTFYRRLDPTRPEGTLATALRVWLGLADGASVEAVRLALAAASRLDAANHFMRLSTDVRASLQDADSLSGPQVAAKADELIHLVQETVVASARCLRITDELARAVGRSGDEPRDVSQPTIKALRDAYEHIEERARGRSDAKGTLDNRVLEIFDHTRLVRENVIEYLGEEFDVAELDRVLEACRARIKRLVADGG